MNIANLFRTPILKNSCKRLLLQVADLQETPMQRATQLHCNNLWCIPVSLLDDLAPVHGLQCLASKKFWKNNIHIQGQKINGSILKNGKFV